MNIIQLQSCSRNGFKAKKASKSQKKGDYDRINKRLSLSLGDFPDHTLMDMLQLRAPQER
jgi:hypothetical protein